MSTYDIHYQLLDPNDQLGGKIFTFGFTSSVGITGPTKLINRWLKCLLTLKGSDPYEPNYGTNCINLIGSNIGATTDLLDIVTLVIEDCNTQILDIDSRIISPDNERLSSANLINLNITNDGFVAYISIKNILNESFNITLPL